MVVVVVVVVATAAAANSAGRPPTTDAAARWGGEQGESRRRLAMGAQTGGGARRHRSRAPLETDSPRRRRRRRWWALAGRRARRPSAAGPRLPASLAGQGSPRHRQRAGGWRPPEAAAHHRRAVGWRRRRAASGRRRPTATTRRRGLRVAQCPREAHEAAGSTRALRSECTRAPRACIIHSRSATLMASTRRPGAFDVLSGAAHGVQLALISPLRCAVRGESMHSAVQQSMQVEVAEQRRARTRCHRGFAPLSRWMSDFIPDVCRTEAESTLSQPSSDRQRHSACVCVWQCL